MIMCDEKVNTEESAEYIRFGHLAQHKLEGITIGEGIKFPRVMCRVRV